MNFKKIITKLAIIFALIIIPTSLRAQHEFTYVAETDGVVFYLDKYVQKGASQMDTVWEKRVILNTPEGRDEAKNIANMFKNIDVSHVEYYYLKNVFDLKNKRTKTLSMYLFNKRHDEIGSLLLKNNSHWQDILPNTITEMQFNLIKRNLRNK